MHVSIIIPCYNAAAFINRSLDSALNQTYPDIEIICIDDGSTDGTDVILDRYMKEHPGKIRVFTQVNAGATKARNEGMKHATGAYLQFLDADDELLPTKIEEQMKLVRDNKQPDLVAGAYTRRAGGADTAVTVHSNDHWEALSVGMLGCTCSNLFKKTSVAKVNGWLEELESSQEAELMFRMLKEGHVAAFHESALTLVHSDVTGSISARDPKNNLLRYLRLRRDIGGWLKATETLTPGRERMLMLNIIGSLHRLYKLDPKEAIQQHDTIFKGHYKIGSGPGVSWFYALCYRIFGFRFTEKLYKLFGM